MYQNIIFLMNIKKKSYRSLSLLEDKINNFSQNLITLENDTKNIIEYVEHKKDKNKKNTIFGNY